MSRAAALAALWLGAACGPARARDYGEQLFNDPAFSGSRFNAWSCATCHATREGDLRLLSGWSMREVAARQAYWGGAVPRLIDAASFCYVYFMRGPAPFRPDEARSRALYEYLASLTRGSGAEALPYTVVSTIADVPAGDPARGEKVYLAACHDCHGALHTGQGSNSALASILPEVKAGYGAQFPGVEPRLVFIEKVRHGRFFGIGGHMPPYGVEQLSDADLGALLAHLGL